MAKEKGYSRKFGEETNKTSDTAKALRQDTLLFGKNNYMFIGIGFLVMVIGLMLMSGGHMDNPEIWDESKIYSFRRITLAPMVIILGLAINVYAIFVKR